jgi:hypothetical protein
MYKRRTNDKRDGCALMFKRDTFDMLHYEALEFNRAADAANSLSFMDRDNIGQVTFGYISVSFNTMMFRLLF